jgi:predicted RNase H-like HicB family nuclease
MLKTNTIVPLHCIEELPVKSYTFKVVLEKDKWPDEPDAQAVWRAYIPALEHRGAHAWGDTPQEALENLKNAVELLIEYMEAQGELIPKEPRSQVKVSQEPLITVTV